MRLLIATPLYPPDIAPLAVYVKELSRRLSKEGVSVTVLAYGHLPEQIPDVEIIPIRKDQPLISRLLAFANALRKATRNADILLLPNGASVELPAFIISLFTRTPIIFAVTDHVALTGATRRTVLRRIFCRIYARAKEIIHDVDMTLPCTDSKKSILLPTPLPRPEILPFTQFPTDAFTRYEDSWKTHITNLYGLLKKYDNH